MSRPQQRRTASSRPTVRIAFSLFLVHSRRSSLPRSPVRPSPRSPPRERALHSSWISRLVSFAVGALLGAVFLELLPHALEIGRAQSVMVTVLAGMLAFFLLEKLVLWRHAHGHDEHRIDADETEHEHALHAHGGAIRAVRG
jgi:zinc transporter ZupT